MSEYWKSTPKYWCKHCKIFIRDTPFEKTQHEATGKHQGNLKRFLRDLHRNHEREERENKRAKDEVQRLTGLVSGSSAGTGSADPMRSRPSASTSNAPRQASDEERKKQMAQLADMGVTIPEEYRRDMALAGEWQTVSERKITPAGNNEDAESSRLNVGVRKRKHEGDEEEEEAKGFDTNMRKGWGSAMRRYPGAAAEHDDLDALLAKTKDVKHKNNLHSETKMDLETEEPDGQKAAESTGMNTTSEATEPVRKEEPDGVHSSEALGQQNTSQEAAPSVIFKKRRNKAAKK